MGLSVASNDLAPRLGLLVIAWLFYFGSHSLLASLWFKERVARARPHWVPAYRLLFNLLAVVLLLPPLVLTYWERGPWLWQWTGWGWWLSNALSAGALMGILWSLHWYDGMEFLGLRQWRARRQSVRDQEGFQLSPLHRYVRHPWYSLGLILVWTRDMDPALLTTALMITSYFLLGSRLEERKLLLYHGEPYRRYRQSVPGLIPVPWRYLSRQQRHDLIANGDATG